MRAQQIILVSGAALLLLVLLIFGRTVPPAAPPESPTTGETSTFDVAQMLEASRARLSPEQQSRILQLEQSVVRGDVREQQAAIYRQLAEFYRDSANLMLPYAYYTGEAAKLENSEKSLTFAARFFLESARKQHDEGMKRWMAQESKQLFEKALLLNPGNDSLKVGLGSCYIFGNLTGNPMEGILMIREVAERDPSNMYAQYMLGMGGLISGQLDRAIERLTLVANAQPDNLEVKLLVAEAYERKGDKAQAIVWYEEVKRRVANPEIIVEIDSRIQALQSR